MSNVNRAGMLAAAESDNHLHKRSATVTSDEADAGIWDELREQQVRNYIGQLNFQAKLVPWYRLDIKYKIYKARKMVKTFSDAGSYLPFMLAGLRPSMDGLKVTNVRGDIPNVEMEDSPTKRALVNHQAESYNRG